MERDRVRERENFSYISVCEEEKEAKQARKIESIEMFGLSLFQHFL